MDGTGSLFCFRRTGTGRARKKVQVFLQNVISLNSVCDFVTLAVKILKIQIRSAQNVGKVWISRKKSSWAHLGPSGPIFCVGRENPKIAQILSIFLGGPMGPIHPIWGHLVIFVRAGSKTAKSYKARDPFATY